MSEHNREARYRIFYLPLEDVYTMLQGWKRANFLYLPNLPSLPPDAEIVACRESFERNSVALKVWSSTFDVVPDGMMAPEEPQPLEAGVDLVKLDEISGVQIVRLNPQRGEVMAVYHPDNLSVQQRQALEETCRMASLKYGCQFLLLPESCRVEHASESSREQDVCPEIGSGTQTDRGARENPLGNCQ